MRMLWALLAANAAADKKPDEPAPSPKDPKASEPRVVGLGPFKPEGMSHAEELLIAEEMERRITNALSPILLTTQDELRTLSKDEYLVLEDKQQRQIDRALENVKAHISQLDGREKDVIVIDSLPLPRVTGVTRAQLDESAFHEGSLEDLMAQGRVKVVVNGSKPMTIEEFNRYAATRCPDLDPEGLDRLAQGTRRKRPTTTTYEDDQVDDALRSALLKRTRKAFMVHVDAVLEGGQGTREERRATRKAMASIVRCAEVQVFSGTPHLVVCFVFDEGHAAGESTPVALECVWFSEGFGWTLRGADLRLGVAGRDYPISGLKVASTGYASSKKA